jgi:hypothetical protein
MAFSTHRLLASLQAACVVPAMIRLPGTLRLGTIPHLTWSMAVALVSRRSGGPSPAAF